MGSKQTSTASAKKRSSKAASSKSQSGKKTQKTRQGKTVAVRISPQSKRAKAASSSKRSKAAAEKSTKSQKNSSTKKKVSKSTTDTASSKSLNATTKTTLPKGSKKTTATKRSKTNKRRAKPVVSSTAKTTAKKSRSKTKTSAAGSQKTTIHEASAKTVSALIPAPTKEVLRPFREAAKRTKKLQKERQKAGKSRNDFLAKQARKGKKYKIDLRVHTPGSYGYFSTGGVDPAPALVRLARVKGLDMIGVTDYYNAAYVDEVRQHAEAAKIVVLPGFDMCCRIGNCDQITAIALFPPSFTGADITKVLNELSVPESAYGRPDYVLEPEFAEVLEIIEKHEGLIIPSRVDKTPYRRLAIPTLVEQFGFHAFDLVHSENPDYFRENWPSGGFTFFTFSNANALGQVGNRSATIKLATPSFQALKDLVARRVELCEQAA